MSDLIADLIQCCIHFVRSLAAGSMSLPSRERKWTDVKGLKYNLTTNQSYVRNYVLSQARKMVLKQTNGLYPAPLRILEVCVLQGMINVLHDSDLSKANSCGPKEQTSSSHCYYTYP
jgi:hypothetical protein